MSIRIDINILIGTNLITNLLSLNTHRLEINAFGSAGEIRLIKFVPKHQNA
tara:strand:- start:91 stop:243 length:153 start_codon:yes stop_codon:yes gene_type:complete